MLPRTPGIFNLLFPNLLFRVKTHGKKIIYLTFDDGPTPFVTNRILDILETYNAKATFFLIGKNADTFTELVKEISQREHSLGSHTYTHSNAWKNKTSFYLNDVQKGILAVPSQYFRPPYGKLTPATYRAISKEKKIVMWDVIGEEYQEEYTWQKCLAKLKKQTRNGSIVVLHDSKKTHEKICALLPEYLQYFTSRGYEFHAL